MGEDDCDVNEELWPLARGAEKGDAVEDVKREPADGKEEENEGQGFGQFQLLAKVASGVCVARCDLEDKNIGATAFIRSAFSHEPRTTRQMCIKETPFY